MHGEESVMVTAEVHVRHAYEVGGEEHDFVHALAEPEQELTRWAEAALDVLMEASGADCAMLLGRDGTVCASIGLSDSEARFLQTGCNAGLAHPGTIAQLATRLRVLTWYHLPVPMRGPGTARVVLATDGMAARQPALEPVALLLPAVGRGLELRSHLGGPA